MSVSKVKIEKNLQRIRENIASACARSGRRSEDVRIVAVTKTVELDTIKKAIEAGLSELGESRIQQLRTRWQEVAGYIQRRRSEPKWQVGWHMVGHLQRNKVKDAVEIGAFVHSVDSLRLAEEINSRAERAGRTMDVLLQVNCSMEAQKYGVAVGAATYLGELIATMSHLRLRGLMTMAALGDSADKARSTFGRLGELFEEMRHEKIGGSDFEHMSMGMTNDYEVAVEEGATMVRLGRALFE